VGETGFRFGPLGKSVVSTCLRSPIPLNAETLCSSPPVASEMAQRIAVQQKVAFDAGI
jgi:hypothetical protein